MPRGFSEQEREQIHASLIEKGKELLASYGIRRSNVEDLTKAVGISKGAFYLFYDSKEELFFEIFEQFEADYRATLVAAVRQPGESPRQRFTAFLQQTFSRWKSSPLFTHFKQEDYELLLRRLPPERVQHHLRDDEAFTAELIELWRAEGVLLQGDAPLIAGAMRALFFISMHEADFNPQVYPTLIDLFIDMLAERLTRSEPNLAPATD